MKTVTVELEPQEVDLLVSSYLARKEKAISERDSAVVVIREMDEKIKRLTFEPEQGPALFENHDTPKIERGPSGRMKRGEPEKFIAAFFQKRNGSGGTIKEACAATGVAYSTVRRIVLDLKDEGKLRQIADEWHWIAKDLSAVNRHEKGAET